MLLDNYMLSSFLKRSGEAAAAFMDHQPLIRDNKRIMTTYAWGFAIFIFTLRENNLAIPSFISL